MRKMKDSGIEWIGKIPYDWEVKKLKYLCKNITDGSHFSPETQFDGKPYITVTDVYDDAIHYESASKISERDFDILEKNGCKPPIHSVLLAKDGTVGRTAIVEYNDYVVLSSLGILNPDGNKVYYAFLKRLLDSQFLQEQMKLAMAGSALRRITITKINKLITIVPPLLEQKRIAVFLDAKCADIDQIRADIEKQIEILTDYKKSVITEAVTKGLDPKAKMKDSGIEWIGKIPEHWDCRPIKYGFKLISGSTPKSDNMDFWDGDVIWITPADYKTEDKYVCQGKRNISYQGFLSCSTSIVPKGSLIFSKRAPIGTVAINSVPLCTNQGCLSCVPKVCSSSLYFYFVFIVYEEVFNLLGSGTTFKEISATTFSNVKLPYPSINEQKKIAAYLDEKCSEIDATIAEKRKQLETLEDYKKSLIFEYVTGKKEVPA